MKLFKTFFVFEAKNRFHTREILIFLAATLLLIFIAQDGTNKYSNTLKNIDVFQKTEALKVQQYILYSQYGAFGLNIMYIPPAFSILSPESTFDGLQANVNTVEKLNIYKGMKGQAFFDTTFDYMNFLGIILLSSVFFGLLYGYDTTKKKIYLRFLSTLIKERQIYIAAVISRIILLSLAIFTAVAISLLWLLIQGINLFQPAILLVGVGIISVELFSFAIGCIIGSFKRTNIVLLSLTAVYLCSLFLIPWVANKNSQIKAGKIESQFAFDLENVKISMAMERRLIDKFGVYKSGNIAPPEIIKAVKDAVNLEHEKLRERENRMKNDMLTTIDRCSTRDAFFPILFYNSISKDISGQGGLNFIDFYSYCQDIKKQFIDFHILKKFETENKPGEVVSFVKGNENLYFPDARINYMQLLLGTGMSLLYAWFALTAGYYLFLRNLYPLPQKESSDDLEVVIGTGNDAFIGAPDDRAVDTFYNILSGRIKRFTGKIVIAGDDAVTPEKKNFVYLCNPNEIPGESSVNGLVMFFKGLLQLENHECQMLSEGLAGKDEKLGKIKFCQLQADQKITLLLRIGRLMQHKIYLIHDLENEMSLDFRDTFRKEIRELKERGAVVIYFGKSGRSLMEMDRYIMAIKDEGCYQYKEFSTPSPAIA